MTTNTQSTSDRIDELFTPFLELFDEVWRKMEYRYTPDQAANVFHTCFQMEKNTAHQAIQQLINEARIEGELSERNRWITPIQKRVFNEINATLSPRITDLINNTKLGNSTVQKALKRLIEVGLVRKIDNIYKVASGHLFDCEYGCKDAGLHYHDQVAQLTKGEKDG